MGAFLIVSILLWGGFMTVSSPLHAAITRIGSVTQVNSIPNTGSSSVSVPSDAEMMVVAISGFESGAGYFSGGTVTIAGISMSVVAADGDNTKFMGAMFYKILPTTGTQTLAWNWSGTNPSEAGVVIAYGFYKGMDTVSPLRDSDGAQQAANPHVSKTLTAQSGDLIVAWMFQYAPSDSTITWTGATSIYDSSVSVDGKGSWAEASPTGNQTVSASGSSNQDGGVIAIVLKQAGGGGSTPASQLSVLGVGP